LLLLEILFEDGDRPDDVGLGENVLNDMGVLYWMMIGRETWDTLVVLYYLAKVRVPK
jgi:hypothetical protein